MKFCVLQNYIKIILNFIFFLIQHTYCLFTNIKIKNWLKCLNISGLVIFNTLNLVLHIWNLFCCSAISINVSGTKCIFWQTITVRVLNSLKFIDKNPRHVCKWCYRVRDYYYKMYPFVNIEKKRKWY